jgi:hypothetical protein
MRRTRWIWAVLVCVAAAALAAKVVIGEECGPICFIGNARLDRRGDLQPPRLARPDRLAVLYRGRPVASG